MPSFEEFPVIFPTEDIGRISKDKLYCQGWYCFIMLATFQRPFFVSFNLNSEGN